LPVGINLPLFPFKGESSVQQVTTCHERDVTMYFNAALHGNLPSKWLPKFMLLETCAITFHIAIVAKPIQLVAKLLPLPLASLN